MTNFAVLFVCMGNICRSPTAHGVFKRKLMDADLAHLVKVDSAGTHNYHPGSPPDERSQVFALKRGYDLSDLRARQISDGDYAHYDLILVMDWDNWDPSNITDTQLSSRGVFQTLPGPL